RLARAGAAHVLELAPARGNLLDHDAGIRIVDIDGDFLDRLEPLAGYGVVAEKNARPRNRHFEAFAPHGFDQHAQLQFATTGDLIGAVAGLAHLDRDIAFGFAEQALADDAALH